MKFKQNSLVPVHVYCAKSRHGTHRPPVSDSVSADINFPLLDGATSYPRGCSNGGLQEAALEKASTSYLVTLAQTLTASAYYSFICAC
jgi:hypothetical protein